MDDVYERLRQRLDDLSTGYPTTESRVETRILQRLFTEEEADFFLQLSPLPETPEDVAKGLGRELEETTKLLEKMAKKGLLFRLKKGDTVSYASVPYPFGLQAFHVKTMDRETALDMDEYFETAFGRTLQSFETPLMRTIPINRKLVAKWPVAPYEDVMEILDNQKVIAIAPCVCRTITRLSGSGCEKPIEGCFLFGSSANYYVENSMGRYISKEEAQDIAKKNVEAGLVMQPFNSQKFGVMCSCCGDCCDILRSLKKQPIPAAAVKSNFFAEVSNEECTACETCLDRCQMEAIEMVDETAVVNLDRCIGCGLCVTTCETGALQLVKKPDEQQYMPPKTGAETYMRIAQERGKNLMPK